MAGSVLFKLIWVRVRAAVRVKRVSQLPGIIRMNKQIKMTGMQTRPLNIFHIVYRSYPNLART